MAALAFFVYTSRLTLLNSSSRNYLLYWEAYTVGIITPHLGLIREADAPPDHINDGLIQKYNGRDCLQLWSECYESVLGSSVKRLSTQSSVTTH